MPVGRLKDEVGSLDGSENCGMDTPAAPTPPMPEGSRKAACARPPDAIMSPPSFLESNEINDGKGRQVGLSSSSMLKSPISFTNPTPPIHTSGTPGIPASAIGSSFSLVHDHTPLPLPTTSTAMKRYIDRGGSPMSSKDAVSPTIRTSGPAEELTNLDASSDVTNREGKLPQASHSQEAARNSEPPFANQRPATQSQCRLESSLANLDTHRLRFPECVDSNIINTVLDLTVATCPLSIQSLDSGLTDGTTKSLSQNTLVRLPKHPDGLVLAPLHLLDAHHWVLAIPTAEKVYIFDSLPTPHCRPELLAKVRLLQHLLSGTETAAAAQGDGATESLTENIICHRQDNGYDCGISVIVNACRVVAGHDNFDEATTDFALWRRVIAALVDPDKYGEIVDRNIFKPLTTLNVEPQPAGLPLDAFRKPMSLAECNEWYKAQRARLEDFKASLTLQAELLLKTCKRHLDTLEDAERVLSDMHQAGGGGTTGGSRDPGLLGRRPRRSYMFSDEVSEAIGQYRTAIGVIKHSGVSDPESVASLEKKLRHLIRLQESRRVACDRLGRVAQLIREEKAWLQTLEGLAKSSL